MRTLILATASAWGQRASQGACTHLGKVVACVGDLLERQAQVLDVLDDVLNILVLLLAGVGVVKAHEQLALGQGGEGRGELEGEEVPHLPAQCLAMTWAQTGHKDGLA